MKEKVKSTKSKNKNLKDGIFTIKELKLYKLTDAEINTVMEYQEKLPVLQQDNGDWINARVLHSQLGVGAEFTTWIKRRLEKYKFEETVDFTTFDKSVKAEKTYINTKEYNITIEMAKQLTMVENNELGNTARKYFIYIEKAFKNRIEWNLDRNGTLIKCKELKCALMKYRKEIIKTIPVWCKGNQFLAEFCMLNEIIIGMTATKYRNIKGLKKSDPIRNTFHERQLEYVDILEQYSADLINIQNIYDYNERKSILTRKFESIESK